MKELEFRYWLQEMNYSQKVISDCVSRLKRIEKNLDFHDLDKEYEYDSFSRLKLYLANDCKESPYNSSLEMKSPKSKYALICSLNKYVSFLNGLN